MSKKLFSKVFILLLVVGLLFAVAPTGQAQAQTPTTLNVADWSEIAPVGVTGRPSVLFDGTNYHMWYGSDAGATALYHTTSTDPAAFDAGTQVTFDTAPLEQSSVTVIKEGDTFNMIAYGADAQEFALYTSTDGLNWTYADVVFDATGMSDMSKIDAPFVFNDGGTFKLYFQKKSAAGDRYYIYLVTSTTVGGTYTNPTLVLSPSATLTDWDGKFVMHPTVVKDGGTYYMWYSAHNSVGAQRIGLATSLDGIAWTKSPANPVIGSVGEPSVIKVGDTWHMYYLGTGSAVQYISATGPFEFQTIQAAINAAANGETIMVFAGTYVEDVTVVDKYFNLIGEVDVSGAPISILEGTLSIDNPSYGSLEKPEFTNIKNIYFEGTDNHLLILKNLNGGLVENCVFDGNGRFIATPNINGISAVSSSNGQQFTVKDSLFKDGLYVGIGGYANGVTVTGSDFTNVKSGINMQGNGNLVVTDSTFLTKPVSDGDSYGIRYTAGDITGAKSMTITGSTFEIDLSGGFTPASGNYHTSIYTRGTGLDTLTVEGNTILGGAVNTSLSATLDVSPNWWGSIAGPAAGTLVGTAEYAPWCGDAECSFLVYPMVGTDLQAAIDGAADNTVIYVPDINTDPAIPDYTQAGGFDLDNDRLTLILGDGVVIKNASPCFNVAADHVRILGESYAGAKCIPTGGWSGFYATIPINDFVVDGIEIDGTNETTGTGFWLEGGSDIQILNNYIHDLSATAIDIYQPVTGVFDIQGNLFQRTAGIIDLGNFGTNAEFNSWGEYTVTKEMANYYCYPGSTSYYCQDGYENIIDFDPWTHAAIELRSTNPTVDNWANQVFVDDEITYEVYGVFQNITAADFTLTYDPTKLEVVSITPVMGIFQSADGDLVDELVEGQIRYDGTTYPGFTSADASGTLLYTVTFKALGAGDAALAIDPATDLFGMIPPSGPSTNVYAAELDSVTVHKIDRPTLTPTNLNGLYVVGVSHEISTVITNPATGGVWTESPTEPDAIGWIRISDALVADITQLQFKYTDGVWYDFSVQDQYGGDAVQQDNNDVIARFGNYNYGFDMPNDWSDVDAFRVTFAEAGTHTVTIGIYDMMDTADNYYGTDDILLTQITQEITVYDPPTVSSDDIQGYYLTGEERIFNVSMDNPEALHGGADYALLIFDYRLDGVSTTDITSFEYYAQDLGAWIDMGSRPTETYGNCTEGVGICGQFGWAPGGFGPIPAGFENISQFRINFANSFSTPLNFTLDLSGKLLEGDADWTPLTTFTGTLDVYDKPIITIETDQYFIVNEPGQFAVTIENPATGRPYGNNIVFDVVIPDHLTTDFGTMSCGFGTTTWPVTLESDGAGGVKARILGLDPEGRFDVGAPFGPMTVTCTATLLTAGDYAPSWSMVDMTLPVERIVQTGSGSMTAYTAPVITAAFPTGPYAAGVPVTVPVSITNPDGIPGPFELILDLPAGTTFTFGGNTYTCDLTGCPAIPLTTLPITDSELVITFAESFTGDIDFTLTDTTWTPDRVLATLTQGVVVGGDYTVTGTFSMQGRTKRAGVEVTFTWGGNSYTVTEETIEQISNNLVAILKYGGDYTITVNQARYLDITTAHGAHINPATALSLVLDSLELRAGDADDDNDVDLDDATIVGGLYGTGTIADRGDINFDNRVNIQDLALIGGNYELQSTTPTADYYAYGDWMQ